MKEGTVAGIKRGPKASPARGVFSHGWQIKQGPAAISEEGEIKYSIEGHRHAERFETLKLLDRGRLGDGALYHKVADRRAGGFRLLRVRKRVMCRLESTLVGGVRERYGQPRT